MAALPASGGVRSLLAKFENSNNNNNNPDVSPSRGRSSADSQDNATNRPLSKVRASFVSVERNGQGSPTPGALRRTESYNTDVDSNQRSATVSPTGQLETASASPFSPSPHKIRTALAAFQGDRVESVTAKLASLAVKDNMQPPNVTEKSDTKPETKSETKPELLEPAIIEKAATKPTPAASTKQAAPLKAIKKSASTMSIAKESSANKNPTKSAATKEKKLTSTPTRSATTTTRPTAHSDKPAGPRTTAVRSSAPAARAERSSTPSHEVTKKPTVQPSPKTKSSSKSPTRPVRLPASLVTPTAASAARTGTLGRSQSHINLRSSPKAEPAKPLSRKPSTLRPDTSRLANHTIPDRPRSRMSTTSSRAPGEESFLARMMRPTASSASKMHDKVEPRSPPRLGKAVKLSPKKDIPAKTGEDKKEKDEKSVLDSAPATPEVKIEKVATGQTAIKEEFNVGKGHQAEGPTVSAVEETEKEAEVSAVEPSSDSVEIAPALGSAAEPSAEAIVEEPKEEATPTESLAEPSIKDVTEDLPTESTLSEDPDAFADNGLASVPETVPEEPETEIREAVPESKTEAEKPHGNAQDAFSELAAEVTVPQEKISDKAEEVPEADIPESEQAIEESVPAAPEGTHAEAVEKAEESAQRTVAEEPLEPAAEKADEKIEPKAEDDN
ncbi:uncharacterized protein BHQ10_005115 [Talaromyces amestolkiae]|uniref:Mucin-7 n=1 Tax=Talaromyces amestolkiae TaxID=1196081 RepID=A0A364KZW3_TALAM|nr:uncharacterized protein BHQ10_005115 [Talaromyces amestolkiae]RAO69103.1 hypothetical protein BHQ10_005115 [Talaromyces amestolkiae]